MYRYRLGEKLGSGAYGQVYKATHKESGQQVYTPPLFAIVFNPLPLARLSVPFKLLKLMGETILLCFFRLR